MPSHSTETDGIRSYRRKLLKAVGGLATVISVGTGQSSAMRGSLESNSTPKSERTVPDLKLENHEEDKRTFTVVAINEQGKATVRREYTLSGGESETIPVVFTTKTAHALIVFIDDGRIATTNASSTARLPDRYGLVVSVIENRIDVYDHHEDTVTGGY